MIAPIDDTPGYYSLREKINEIIEIVNALDAAILVEEKSVKERWKPIHNQRYFNVHLDDYDINVHATCWLDLAEDFRCYELGNIFPSEQEALNAAEKVKELLLSLHEEV